jgi:DNA modification methylase
VVSSLVTKQVKREATTSIAKNGVESRDLIDILPFGNNIPKSNRRNLRYGPHGIHEYRGKFFPQLVRSLLNISGVSSGAKVLDPMCGSGTTPVEASLMGCEAYGIDLNPLSILISTVKTSVLHLNPVEFEAEYIALLKRMNSNSKRGLSWLNSLDKPNIEYLTNWFSRDILIQLDPIIRYIEEVKNPICKDLFRIVFSNILRKVSWQKLDDLRVRKEVRKEILEINVLSEFKVELHKSFRSILVFLLENESSKVGKAKILEGDSRFSDKLLKGLVNKIDVVITSPPYATALPYLDTDRLSLYYLNLMSRKEHRIRDYDMIGNREITNALKVKYWDNYLKNKESLPKEITSVIDRIDKLNRNANVGFRRKNMSTLLSKYFLDMRESFQSFSNLLKPGGSAFVVIGNNHTTAGGKKILIETDEMLAILGKSIGLHLKDKIPMDMLTSRDIFKKNAGSAETILHFKK